MNVLHIYSKNDAQAERYVGMLTTSLSHSVDLRSACDAETVGQMCQEWKPDIVHQHGNVSTSVLAPLSALQPAPRWVITPHGQSTDLHHAYVVVARSQMEHEQLKALHPRIETVRNPLITRTVTTGDCARKMLRIYLRVTHSDVLPLMNDATRQLLPLLLNAAICGDCRWVGKEKVDTLISQTSASDFPLLYIYAEQEGVLTLVEEGLRLLGISAPAREPAESYLPLGFKPPKPLLTDGVRESADLTSDIVRMLLDIQQNGPTLLRLAETAMTLRNDRLDEGALLKELNQQNLKDFLACLLPLLAEQTGLTEGFMPCPPTDNKTTEGLRSKLINRFRL